MERMMLKGLVFIIGIWVIWNANQGMQNGIKEIAEQRANEAKIKSNLQKQSQNTK